MATESKIKNLQYTGIIFLGSIAVILFNPRNWVKALLSEMLRVLDTFFFLTEIQKHKSRLLIRNKSSFTTDNSFHSQNKIKINFFFFKGAVAKQLQQ